MFQIFPHLIWSVYDDSPSTIPQYQLYKPIFMNLWKKVLTSRRARGQKLKKFAEFSDSPRVPAWSNVRLITLPRNTLNVETSSNLFEWHFSKTNRKKLGWDEGNSSTEARTLSRHRRDSLWHFPQVFSQVKTQQICSPQIMRRRDGFIRQIQFHNILCYCHYSWSCRELSKHGQQELWIHPAKKKRNDDFVLRKEMFWFAPAAVTKCILIEKRNNPSKSGNRSRRCFSNKLKVLT